MVGQLQPVSRNTPEQKGKASRQGSNHNSNPNCPSKEQLLDVGFVDSKGAEGGGF